MNQSLVQERRCYARSSVRIPVTVFRPDAYFEGPWDCRLDVISQSGALLLATEGFLAGEWVVVRVDANNGQRPMEIAAIVERNWDSTEGYRVACRFPEPLDSSLCALLR